MLLLVLLSGCSSYELRGRVVAGARASVQVVPADDPRLTQERGIPDADLTLTLDPERLSREVVGRGTSRSDGSFVLPVSATGAGFLIHDVELVAQRAGYAASSGMFQLPDKKRRVLVTVAVGDDRRSDDRSLIQQTIDDAEPFLQP